MAIFVFLRWMIETMDACEINEPLLEDLPKKLAPHLWELGTYLMAWVGCN